MAYIVEVRSFNDRPPRSGGGLLQKAHACMWSKEGHYGTLLLLAFGIFAVGIDGFVIGGILPEVARDLSVSAALVGQLFTAYALAYAITSPILTTITSRISRRDLMVATMWVFTLANIFAAFSPNFGSLLIANVLLGMAAGLFVPGANVLAGMLVPVEKRGFAIAFINVGFTLAIALGVSFGSLLASATSWHMTFGCVSLVSAMASVGRHLGLPKGIGSHLSVPTLRERLFVAKRPEILLTLLVTTLWQAGTTTVYTYLALYLNQVLGIASAYTGYFFFLWGISAGIGVLLGGIFVDRLGQRAIMVPCLFALAGALAFMSMAAHVLSAAVALVPVSTAIAVWAMANWGFYPGLETRLIRIAGLNLSTIVLSLNASFLYLGRSLGAIAGSLVIAYGSSRNLGFFAAVFEVASVTLLLAISRSREQPR